MHIYIAEVALKRRNSDGNVRDKGFLLRDIEAAGRALREAVPDGLQDALRGGQVSLGNVDLLLCADRLEIGHGDARVGRDRGQEAAKLAFHSFALAAKRSERYWPQMSTV